MAEKNESKAKQTTERKIICKGPVDKNNGAIIFRLPPERKAGKPFDIVQGQTLTVGSDISEETADQLLDSKSWKFEEVTK
ncbi:hypothetical protein ICR95_20910 [Priestia megaterium]|uniref:AbrB family transcriptional regulator n=1 Tax=Priestia megaterium TaxID=1404 RepID=A0AAX6BDN3_PRIMG|nr:hypothetical protein [Priestia megaterium]QSF32530.1 hypothetical protein ICR95_20910 [Priestia megaterium]GMG71820.1 hypothetical protein ShirakiTB12_02880 [Priestia megaterium]